MKRSKEFKISMVLYVVSIVVFIAVFITGLLGGVFVLDKIGYFLGVTSMCLGTLFYMTDQSKQNSTIEDNYK